MRVEVWIDVVCPWCYIGKRRLETTLARYEHTDTVDLVWRSYQLEPGFPSGAAKPVRTYLAEEFRLTPAQARKMTDGVGALAAEEGLAFDTDRARMVNTLDAHRLAHLAGRHGLRGQMYERLMRAHHIEGESLGDLPTLVRLGAETGVPAEEARRVLDGDAYVWDVQEDAERATEFGAAGVPFFVLDGAFGFSGAQPVATLLSSLRAVHSQEEISGAQPPRP